MSTPVDFSAENPFMTLERLYLRPVEPGDAGIVAACNNHPEVRVSFFTHTPVSLSLTEERVRDYYRPGSDYIPFLICLRSNGEGIGVTALHRVDLVSRAAVFSLCLSVPEYWGRGYAKEASAGMLKYAFEILNLHRLQLHVWADNAAAIAIYEKLGFKREGTLREAMKHDGKYCDFHVMGLLEDEWRSR